MGSGQSKGDALPRAGTPANYMYMHFGKDTVKFLGKWNALQFPLEGSFDKNQILHLRGALESLGSKISQPEWQAFFSWYDEVFRRIHESQVRSLRDSLDKLQHQVKTLTDKSQMPVPTAPPPTCSYPQLMNFQTTSSQEDVIYSFSGFPPTPAEPPPAAVGVALATGLSSPSQQVVCPRVHLTPTIGNSPTDTTNGNPTEPPAAYQNSGKREAAEGTQYTLS
ncbi:uncharacterized protein LOC128324404 [Hemicordylus capensis]|uniref:uncharacterized protein LOC128324404 n=1 Tax=Hemicordylus capensis TaxID=884348 RepID=UPI00230322AD|nr:uncharacterized protein LOC128324404 [Hemicordylus capensis]